MTKRSLFFMTRGDLLDWLSGIEEELALSYRLMGPHPSSLIPFTDNAASIPQLGFSQTGDCVRDESYLVLPQHVQFVPHVVKAVTGETRYFVYPEGNPASVILSPGGEYRDQYVVIGELSTQSTDPRSLALFKSLVSRLKSIASRHRSIYVGTEAALRAKDGIRLSERVAAPIESDLRLEGP